MRSSAHAIPLGGLEGRVLVLAQPFVISLSLEALVAEILAVASETAWVVYGAICGHIQK